MRVLVLGSRGVIGKALVSQLQSKGHDVTEWDCMIDLKHDLSNALNNPGLQSVVSQNEFVFFLAFDVGGAKFITKPTIDFLSRNSLIMANTFSTLENKRFIFASSTMSNMGVPYGTLKLIGQQYTKLLNGVSARFWNVYGMEDYGEKSHVITDFIHQYKSTGKISMLSSGSEERQFLHARDCAECLEVMMCNFPEMPDIVDVTSFEWKSIRTVAELICQKITAQPGGNDSHTEKNEPDGYILKFWRPSISLREGITELLKPSEQENESSVRLTG